MDEIDLTHEIKNIFYNIYPDVIDEIKHQYNSQSEAKRFVKYVIENTGRFGHIIFMSGYDFRKEMENVDWSKVVK